MNNALRPETAAIHRRGGIADTIFFIGFEEITAAAKGSGCKEKVMKAFAVGNLFGVEPDVFQIFFTHVSDNRYLAEVLKKRRAPKVLLSETPPEVELQDSKSLMQEV